MNRTHSLTSMATAEVEFEWRGSVANDELNALHAEAFGHDVDESDWKAQLERYSLGWVCARRVVAKDHERRGIGAELVKTAALCARERGIRWLHVDFETHLAGFCLDACGFQPTPAELIDLAESPRPL